MRDLEAAVRHVHITVAGQVQGVGFRYHTYTMARQLGITGWVRNEYDGTVEIEAQGGDREMSLFLAEVKKGPFHARVDHMMALEISGKGDFHTFDIR